MHGRHQVTFPRERESLTQPKDLTARLRVAPDKPNVLNDGYHSLGYLFNKTKQNKNVW